jgi:3'-phosphoadenosine 5'-phosphosulfate sulfotransferase (PAPS reductase)/FAD synthetase
MSREKQRRDLNRSCTAELHEMDRAARAADALIEGVLKEVRACKTTERHTHVNPLDPFERVTKRLTVTWMPGASCSQSRFLGG